jgi:hypothetical protein
MKKISILVLFSALLSYSNAQIVINEASNRNFSQIDDEAGNQYDWLELYNSGSTGVNLNGWTISDNKSILGKWVFPSCMLSPDKYLLLFASGLNVKSISNIDHWESAVLPSDTFDYLEPDAGTPVEWTSIDFNTDDWKKGCAGFGYGDNDDNSVTNSSSLSVYIRKSIEIVDTSSITDAILHVDYDDGFVAYLNGTEIARNGINGTPLWNSLASINHEALMYQGGMPEIFQLDMHLIQSIWKEGKNVFAIEIHNYSATSTDLSLIPYLSFGINNGNTYFHYPPDWFTVIKGKTLHTNFKISSKGETLYLSNPQRVVVDSLTIPRIPLNSSVGRTSDGAATKGIFLSATPGKSNNTSHAYTNGFEPSPQFNVPAGFYTSGVGVIISDSSTTSVIRYTTDGSEPVENSTLYNGLPIVISTTKTLKARSFSTIDKMPGKTKTATYFINKKHSLPVISITTNNENLYGVNGIFDYPGASWNKPCYIEYFDNNKQLAFAQEAGIQIDGGAGGSRTQPQHSVRIEPGNSTLGDGNVHYKLIPDRPNRENYSSFYLRNGSNQYATLQYKDGFEVKALGKNSYNYYSAYTPIVVYLNGEYFGLYELREKLNADYLSQNYLMNNDSLDMLTLSYYKGLKLEALEGSTDQFWADFNNFRKLSPTDNTYLDKVSQFLDLDNYTDYIIAQSWIGNVDWPNNNIRVFRNKSTGYKWRYALLDVEWSLNPNGWSTSATDHIAYMESQDSNLPYIGYWLGLIQNSNYKISFINRFADLMNTNYLFSNIGPMEEEMYLLQKPEMEAEFARWGNSDMTAYNSNHNIFRDELSVRSSYVRQHLQSHYVLTQQVTVTLDVKPVGAGQIKISTVSPVSYPWSGIYFSNIPVKVIALPNPGYKFSGWDNNPLIANINNPEFIVTMSNTTEDFTANFEVSESAFQGVTVSEIHYKNSSLENSTDWIELFNAGEKQVNLKGWYFTDNDSLNKFRFNEFDVIEPNSRFVIARNTYTFSQKYPDVSDYTGPISFKLGLPVDAVKLYNSTKTLVAEVNYSDLYPWPLNGDESGRTLELKNPERNLNDPDNWFAGCIGGSPAADYKPCSVSVNEKKLFANYTTLSAYPIPAGDYMNVTISFIKSSGNSTLKIYNIFGTEVKSIVLGNIEAKTYTTLIDLSKIPTGILLLQFQSDNVKENIKFVHVR